MKYPTKISKLYLLKLSIPIFFANLAIPLVGIIDIGLMGHLDNIKFLTAVSISTSIITMIFWSFGFLRMGTVGLVSQALGKSDYREIVLITLRNFCLAIIFSLIIMFCKNPILDLVQNYFNTDPETQSFIKKYITVRILSTPAELIIYVLIGFYLGLQKTFISSLITTFFSLANIFLSIYFVRELNLDILGVALGTVVSSYLTISIFIVYTYFFVVKNFKVLPRYQRIFSPKKLLKLFNINFDIFIRTILLTFSFLWFTYQSSLLGEEYVAINAILLQFVIISAFFLDAYAFSTEGVAGFLLGKKIKKAFIFLVKNSFEISFYTSLTISLIFLFLYKDIINILTDIEYLRYLTYGFVIWIFFIPPIASFSYQYDGIFIGTSQTGALRNAMIISVFIFIIISIELSNNFGNNGLWLAFLLFMFFRALSLHIYFPKILKKF